MRFLWLCYLACIFSCAGPTTPHGPVNRLLPPQHQVEAVTQEEADFVENSLRLHTWNVDVSDSISFWPPRQVLHRESKLRIDIKSANPIGENYRIKFYYNGKEFSESFLENARVSISSDQRQARLEVDDFKLPSKIDHQIAVLFWPDSDHSFIGGRYLPPDCPIGQTQPIINTESFRVEAGLVEFLKTRASEYGINPALLAGLIAQESSFNPKAVSWAKAIGLTQITHLADLEMEDRFQDWPRNPLVLEFSAPVIKAMILSGAINQDNEWRLNPERSIIGGLAFLQHLSNYWSHERNSHFLKMPGDYTKAILASYNSGAARVKRSFKKYDDYWLSKGPLQNMTGYTNRIMSFCYHFGQQESPI